jgi:hypothetical protein
MMNSQHCRQSVTVCDCCGATGGSRKRTNVHSSLGLDQLFRRR